jgi:hypothetical protein
MIYLKSNLDNTIYYIYQFENGYKHKINSQIQISVQIFNRPKMGEICLLIAPRHQEKVSRRIAHLWLGSSTNHRYCSCGTHNMFRWTHVQDPRIHEIFVWDPHILVCGAHNSIA